MKLIITRPKQDCATIADALRERGHDVTLAPLIKIEPRTNVEFPDLPYQAVCLTSANAARHLPAGVSRDLSAFVLGAQSAVAAIGAGFVHVEAKGGNVEGLAANMKKFLRPERGPILYVSGNETSGDLAGALTASGFLVSKVITYDAVPQTLTLSAEEVAMFDGVLLYSRRTARIWAQEIQRLMLLPRLSHFCLSSQIIDALPEQWRRHAALEPTETSLLAMIDLVAK